MSYDQEPTSVDKPKFTGRHMLGVIVAFFTVIFIANFTMVFFASKSWTGLVVKNSYVASQNFNKNIAAQEKFEQDGWQGNMQVEKGVFSFRLTRAGQAIDGCKVIGDLQRPVSEDQDYKLVFTSKASGTYKARRSLKPGRWNLLLKAQCPDVAGTYTQRYQFTISSSAS